MAEQHISLKRTAQTFFFFCTDILGTVATVGDNHFSNLAYNIVRTGSIHPPVIGALLPSLEALSPTGL